MSVEFYEKNAESFIAQTAEVEMAALYQRFCEGLPQGASVLDVGCGSGRDALAFSEMGYNVVAMDASEKMVDATRERAGVATYLMTFEDLKFDQSFDAIWACASLLHVRRNELAKALKRLSLHLVPNGILYASFKYGDGEREKGDRYFNDMNEQLLAEHLVEVPNLLSREVWVTQDQRSERGDERWLNCILTHSQV